MENAIQSCERTSPISRGCRHARSRRSPVSIKWQRGWNIRDLARTRRGGLSGRRAYELELDILRLYHLAVLFSAHEVVWRALHQHASRSHRRRDIFFRSDELRPREEPAGIGDVTRASFVPEPVVSAESWRCCVKLRCLRGMVLGRPIEVVGDGFENPT